MASASSDALRGRSSVGIGGGGGGASAEGGGGVGGAIGSRNLLLEQELRPVSADDNAGIGDNAPLGRILDQDGIGVVDVRIHASREREMGERGEAAVGATDGLVSHLSRCGRRDAERDQLI